MRRSLEAKSSIRIRALIGTALMVAGVFLLLVFIKALYEAVLIWELFSFIREGYQGLPIILTGLGFAVLLFYLGWRVARGKSGERDAGNFGNDGNSSNSGDMAKLK